MLTLTNLRFVKDVCYKEISFFLVITVYYYTFRFASLTLAMFSRLFVLIMGRCVGNDNIKINHKRLCWFTNHNSSVNISFKIQA